MQTQIMGMLHQITGVLSEPFQKQLPHSCYSKEQAELLAETPGINMLMSSEENNWHL